MTGDAVGGVWTYALELASALEPYGVDVTLAVMGPSPSSGQMDDALRRPNLSVRHADFRLEWMEDPWLDVEKASTWLLDIAEDISPDVVQINGYAHAALPWSVPVVVVTHSCVLSWWRGVYGADAPASYEQYREHVARGLHAADYVVSPTRALLTAVESHYGRVKRSAVIPNARTADELEPAAKQPFILSVGRIWDPMKNIKTVAAAAVGLSCPVFVAGEQAGPDGALLNLENVNALGFLSPSEMAGWYKRALVFAHPARYEPFGLAPLEAGLAGCALVLSNIDTLREVWGDCAVYVDPDDVAGLHAILDELCADSARAAELGSRARERALTFSPERMGTAYYEVYSCAS